MQGHLSRIIVFMIEEMYDKTLNQITKYENVVIKTE